MQISLALTTALEHLHANGLVHRDVPEIEIETLDFVSKMTKCAPFLVTITAE